MSKFAYHTTLRRLKNNNGVVGGLPRIYSIDDDSYWYGYAEVNVDATSPFARVKVHDLRVQGDSTITDGSLIKDRVDNSIYLVMSIKGIYSGGLVAYKDGTLYLCNTTATIKRFQDGARDTFGKLIIKTPTVIASRIYIMTNPQNYTTIVGQDTIEQANKIKIAIQSKHGVKLKDRIETSTGQNYIVENIDTESLTGMVILYCDTDLR